MSGLSPQDAKRMLSEVEPEKAFVFKDGTEIKSIKELYSAIQSAEESVFSHHFNEERNDFGTWVKDVHKDYRLANSLFSAKNQEECASAISERLYEMNKVLEQPRSIVLTPPPKINPPGETASERLEKILSDAVRGKVDGKKSACRSENKEENTIKPASELRPIEKFEIEPPEKAGNVLVNDEVEEIIKFTESKSASRQVLSEIWGVVSKPNVKGLFSDIKQVVKRNRSAEREFFEVVKQEENSDPKKEKIISYLEKVYK